MIVLFALDRPLTRQRNHQELKALVSKRPSVRKQTIGPDPRDRARLTASTMEARTTKPVQR